MKLKAARSLKIFLVLLLVSGVVWHFASTAHAAFNQNNVMDNAIFDDAGSMDGPAIDAWLNANFPNSCISTNNHFSDALPTGYTPSSGFTYYGVVSAGSIISTVAHVYGINPKVILATLEKESSVVSGNASYRCQYINTSMGFDCPDSGSCPQNPATESGFSKQIIHAAWMLKFHEQRSQGRVGWNVQLANYPLRGDYWDNSDDPQSCYGGRMTEGTYARCPSQAAAPFDGLTTIDSQTVHLDDGATAALYDYTPHFHGNQLFDNIYIGWFGNIYASAYTDGYFAESGWPALNPGQQGAAWIEYQNLGSASWYDDISAPAGTNPVHLSTAKPLNRGSVFGGGWPGQSRPTLQFSAVYEPDGTTLAANQHVVGPGEIGRFTFSVVAQSNQTAGSYQEYFQPVLEGSSSQFFNDPGTFMGVTVNSAPNIAWDSQSTYPTVPASTQATSQFMKFKNTGNVPLYDDQSIGRAPAGSYPTHLATDCPLNSNSQLKGDDWYTANRPSVNFNAVYNSDGSLASDQHVAQPGQIVKFTFAVRVPSGQAANTYKLCVQPILEGTSAGTYADLGAFLNVTVPTQAVISYPGAATSYPMVSGERKSFSLPIQNVGNASLAAGSTVITNNGANYHDSSWPSANAIVTIPSAIAAGASANAMLTFLAPTTTSNRTDSFPIQINDSGNSKVYGSDSNITIPLAAPSYNASYTSESASFSGTYGQSTTAFFRYKNTGNKPWYDDSSYTTTVSTRNALPTHLATDQPLNRSSSFAYSWPGGSNNRAAVNFNAVYAADNATLSSNQHVVQPGEIAQFTFPIAAKAGTQAGTSHEYFRPIIEGLEGGGIPFQWTYIDMTLNTPNYSATYYGQSTYPNIAAGSSAAAYIMYKNTGNVTWYSDAALVNAPGKGSLFAVHLATSHNLNRSSLFSAGWPGGNRPAVTFATVYNTDGTTLSSDQTVVQPGQIAKFAFNITAPNGATPGTYREFFQPIGEGSSAGLFNDTWTFLDVSVR